MRRRCLRQRTIVRLAGHRVSQRGPRIVQRGHALQRPARQVRMILPREAPIRGPDHVGVSGGKDLEKPVVVHPCCHRGRDCAPPVPPDTTSTYPGWPPRRLRTPTSDVVPCRHKTSRSGASLAAVRTLRRLPAASRRRAIRRTTHTHAVVPVGRVPAPSRPTGPCRFLVSGATSGAGPARSGRWIPRAPGDRRRMRKPGEKTAARPCFLEASSRRAASVV